MSRTDRMLKGRVSVSFKANDLNLDQDLKFESDGFTVKEKTHAGRSKWGKYK